MSEPKKVAFSTLGPVKKEKKPNKKAKSVRLNLTLAESNEKFCPEFHYRELVSLRLHEKLGKKRLGDVINGPALDPTDPFASDEDAALKALAKQLENKYASYVPKKKKRRKENDFSTLGEGYDETDPFIDNSDAFDEVVPTHMETKHRGFYINSGELDFEEVAQEESPDEDSVLSETEVRRKKMPNRIESDAEDESEDEDEDNSKVERNVCENGIIRPKKRKLDEGELLRKRKKMIGKFNAKNQEKKDSDPENEKVINGCESKGKDSLLGAYHEQSFCDSETPDNNPGKEYLGDGQPPNEQSIAASIEAVISKAREEAVDKKSDTQESASGSDSSSSDSDSSGSSSSSDSDSEEEEDDGAEKEVCNNEGEREEDEDDDDDDDEGQDLENGHQYSQSADDIPLPDDLPPDLILVLTKLKEEGHACKGSSQKFFTDSVNRLLLSIVFKLHKLGGRKKTQIYNHLSQHLPCGTQTIVKRSKNLLSEKQENKLREPLKKLKEAIDAQMPLMIEQHAVECQKAAETKGENGVPQNEEEEEDGDKKKCRLPKKKFVFTDEIRKYLCDVVRVRVQFWHLIKKRSESAEEHIRAFLDSDVRPLWPKGWINARLLLKESYYEHVILTGSSRVKTTPVKKTVSLGGGCTTGNVVPNSSSIATQPPKPSLTATVIPKNLSPPVSSPPKSDVLNKKPSVCSEQKTCVKPEEDVAATTTTAPISVGLSIKSVEKINEGADRIIQDVNKVSESGSNKGITELSQKPSAEDSSLKVSLVEKSPSKKDDVSVIDLSSDDDKTTVNKVPHKVNPSSKMSDFKRDQTFEKVKVTPKVISPPIKPSEVKHEQTLEKDRATVSGSTSVIQKVASAVAVEGKKEDNLEEEMNLVMNEILQISKQKSVDGSPEKVSISIDNLPTSTVISSISKEQKESKSQVQTQMLHQQHSHTSIPSVQSDKYSQKSHHLSSQHHTSSSVKQPRPVQQTSPVQEPKHSHSSSIVPRQQQHSSSVSPKQQQQQHSSSVSPKRQQQQHSSSVSPKQLQHSSSVSSKQQQQHSSSVASKQHHSSSVAPKQQQHSSSVAPKQQQHSSSVAPKQQQHSSSVAPKQQQHSSSVAPKQQHSSAAPKQQHTSVAPKPQQQQQQQHHHASSVAPKQQHSSSVAPKQQQPQQTSPVDLHKHSTPHNSQTQSKSPLNVQPNSCLQPSTSPNQPKEVQQPKSMQPSQSHHHHQSVSLQKTNSQQSLGMQYSSQAQLKPVSDLSHKKLSVQQFAQPHPQQPLQQKTINVSVTSWNKSETSVSSKHSPESTKKTHTSWASNDMSVPRQKQQDNVQVVSPVDPLANLRMMHGLSVSNVNKRSSGSSSSSLYHNPVLATSATTYNPTSTVKISSSNSSNSVSRSLTQTVNSSSKGKHSSSSISSTKTSKHTTNPKPRLDSYAGAVSQSMYNSISQEQLNVYKQQLQQQKQSNHLSSQQQELWQQMNATSYLPGMGAISNAEMMKLVSQIGKSVDSYSQSSQSGPYPNPGTPTSVSSHLTPYGDASRGGSQHSHHISSHHLHPTHGGSEQHRGQY